MRLPANGELFTKMPALTAQVNPRRLDFGILTRSPIPARKRVRRINPTSAAPAGVQGEITIRAPFRMISYFNRPEEQDQLMRDGWLYSGDCGVLDQDGYLFIQDRIKDIIISASENISPREIEEILFQIPEVADAAVIGVPHDKCGEAVHAVVVPRPNAHLNEAEVITFVRARLAHFKCPKSVEFVSVLPRDSSGKILSVTCGNLIGEKWADASEGVRIWQHVFANGRGLRWTLQHQAYEGVNRSPCFANIVVASGSVRFHSRISGNCGWRAAVLLLWLGECHCERLN